LVTSADRHVRNAGTFDLHVSLLGPVRVVGIDGEVVIGATKERLLIAALALRAGQFAGPDALIEALWGERPPASARKTLQTYVSNLRRALGAEAIRTEPHGYSLQIEPTDVDVHRFRALVRDGEAALRRDDHDAAARSFAAAVDLWHGEPLGTIAPDAQLAAEAARLNEELLAAHDGRLTAELACGRHRSVVGELEALTRAHPYRERLWIHLAVALYRCGRHVDALDVCRRFASVLRDELGLEPGPELARLEHSILDHDPSLEWSPPQDVAHGGERHGTLTRPPLQYAVAADGTHVAYEVVGTGAIDLVVVGGFVSHLDIWWEEGGRRFLERLAPHCRVILFDKRGMGLSDRPPSVDIEQWTDDVRTVLDAVGSVRAVVFGISSGSQTSCLFAATHPERARAMVMWGGCARTLRADDWTHGWDRQVVESFARHLERGWGTGAGIEVYAPTMVERGGREFWARYQRISASPGAAVSFMRAVVDIDVRHALGTIQCPTLVLHATTDVAIPFDAGRATAEAIPNATFVALDSPDHLIWISPVLDEIIDQIERFVTSDLGDPQPDRTLATVLTARYEHHSETDDGLVPSVMARHGGRSLAEPHVGFFPGPRAALRCAEALIAEDVAVAVGIHSGECTGMWPDLDGSAIAVAERVAACADRHEVLASQTVHELLLGSSVRLEPAGSVTLDGLADDLSVFRMTS
jgi:DNA-binding SARP family transcriptional activator/pimeloyl-ACP methyl ester carboxylesterase